MIDIIYKTAKPSHFKKLEIIQNINNLMFKVIFIFSDWILIKQTIVSSTPFCCWGEQIFKKMLPGEWVICFCLGCDDKNLWEKFDWGGGAWVKMPRFNAYFSNVNTINLNIFPTHGGIYKFVRKFNKHSGERKTFGVYRIMKCVLEANLEGQGWYLHCLPSKKWRQQKKRCVEIEGRGTSVHLYWGFCFFFVFFFWW